MRTFATTAALAVCTATLAAPLATTDAAASVTTDADVATATPIQHLVVIYQENASFDHYFGTYPVAANPPGDPPFEARTDTPPVNNLLPSSLNGNRDLRATNPNQSKPFRLDRTQFVTCSQNHDYKAEQRAANQGRMDRFVQQTDNSTCKDLPRPVPAPQTMGYFDGNTVTALWNYAQHFALNDYTFGTTYGPSTPGALNLVAGRTSGASPDNDKNVTEGVVYGDPDPRDDDCADGATRMTMSGTNVGDLLSGAGVSWGWFQGGFARANPVDEPTAVCDDTSPNLAGFADSDYEAHHDPFQYFASTGNPHHLPPSSDAAIGHDDQANHQYDLRDFWTAGQAGDLPAVSFLKAPGFQDGHPGPKNSNPLDEQDFLVETLNRIQQLPQWSSTAVVLAWDDSDGWYDHQFPPNVHHSHNATFDTLYGVSPAGGDQTTLMCMAPPGQHLPVDDPSVFEMRCGYGERLPLLVVSPYARDNYVDHTPTDQTSILRFIEDNWGLGRLGDASFDAEAGSLLNMFDFGQQRDDTLLLNHYTGNVNRPPSIDSLTVTPGDATTGDTLTVSATTGDPDRDVTNPHRADHLQLSYEWFNGSTRLAESGPTLDLSVPGNGDRGDLITVRATASDGLDATTTSTSVEVGDSAPAISLAASSATVVYSDGLTPIGVTTSDPDGDDVTVEATGLPPGLAVSQVGDDWQVGGDDQAPAGTYDAVVRVSDGELVAEVPLRIEVRRESAQVGYTGDLLFSTGSATASTADVVLRARVSQAPDGSPGDLTRAGVLFDVYAPGNSTGTPDATYAASPTAGGEAKVDIGSRAVGTWTVVVRTDPSAGYFEAPASDVVPVTVYAPRAGTFVTGAGWVHDPGYLDRPVPIATDDRGTFGLEARPRKDGSPSGVVAYAFAGADDKLYVVRSTGWQGGGLAISGDRATIAGTCEVIVLDPVGHVVTRSTGDTFRLDVTDVPRSDTFALSVYRSDGTLHHRVGTPAEPLRLGGGQVVVHH
jgi:phospholipase C